MKRYTCEWLQEAVRRRERSLEVMRKLLKLKLITKRADLTVLVIYYRVCNAILRAVVKVAAHFSLDFTR
jgi:hypothetical protein